jgi:hypothetical protein
MPLPEGPGLKDQLKRVLNREATSEHFVAHYAFRDGCHGLSGSVHGVRNRNLVSVYLDNLERVFRAMSLPLNGRRKPSSPTSVYVCSIAEFLADGDPATILDKDEKAYILLPSRSQEPSLANALSRAAAEAVHEAAHVLNWVTRPPFHLAPDQVLALV